ncbi:hypothetical protein THAOC_06160, partial [Thalassiosira oceanica]
DSSTRLHFPPGSAAAILLDLGRRVGAFPVHRDAVVFRTSAFPKCPVQVHPADDDRIPLRVDAPKRAGRHNPPHTPRLGSRPSALVREGTDDGGGGPSRGGTSPSCRDGVVLWHGKFNSPPLRRVAAGPGSDGFTAPPAVPGESVGPPPAGAGASLPGPPIRAGGLIRTGSPRSSERRLSRLDVARGARKRASLPTGRSFRPRGRRSGRRRAASKPSNVVTALIFTALHFYGAPSRTRNPRDDVHARSTGGTDFLPPSLTTAFADFLLLLRCSPARKASRSSAPSS